MEDFFQWSSNSQVVDSGQLIRTNDYPGKMKQDFHHSFLLSGTNEFLLWILATLSPGFWEHNFVWDHCTWGLKIGLLPKFGSYKANVVIVSPFFEYSGLLKGRVYEKLVQLLWSGMNYTLPVVSLICSPEQHSPYLPKRGGSSRDAEQNHTYITVEEEHSISLHF